MKISTLLILISIWFLRIKIANGNYRRVIRGPPQPPRPPPPHPGYFKKWAMPPPPPPPRQLLRPRPIPVKPPPSFKKPIGPPVLSNRHLTPVRSVWKNPPTFKTATDKPFLSSPTISLPEYDYHIQTNNIPTHINTIKQIGEKGPIHTIPAPNLSPADKPSHIEPVKQNPIYQQQQQGAVFQQHQQNIIYQQQQPQQQNLIFQQQQQQQPQHQHTIVEIQKAHQYQVTEATDLAQHVKFYEAKQTVGSDENQEVNNIPSLAHAEFLIAPQPEQDQQLSPRELYKLLNSYPQQQLVDSYGQPVAQQPQLQQHMIRQQQLPNYQAILTHANPSFNYEDQQNKQQISSRIAAGFNVQGDKEDNTSDALAQTQYVQHFFDTREDHAAAENAVEADANFSDDIPKDAFYSTLPNQQAAEALASLQEAGELNSQQGKNVETKSTKLPMTIYVPDDFGDGGDQDGSESKKFEEEEDMQGEPSENLQAEYQVDASAYGDRVKPKMFGV